MVFASQAGPFCWASRPLRRVLCWRAQSQADPSGPQLQGQKLLSDSAPLTKLFFVGCGFPLINRSCPRRFPTLPSAPHMIRISKWSAGWASKGVARVWTPTAGLPAATENPQLVILLWKVGLPKEGSPLSGLSSRLAKQASRLRSSRPRPGWSRCCGWSRRACFRQVLSIFHLPPSPRLGSWHPAGRSHFLPTPFLQGSFRVWLGLSGHRGFRAYEGQTSHAPRKLGPRRPLAEVCSVSSGKPWPQTPTSG